MGTGYSKVPSTPVHKEGTISEEQASKSQGLRVHIGVPEKGGRIPFTVEVVDPSSLLSLSLRNILCLFLVISVVFSVFGGVFIRFYSPYEIGIFLNQPSSICTITNYTITRDSTILVDVVYYDAENVMNNGSFSISDTTFNDNHWDVGSNFTCMYKGGVIMAKQSIQDEYDNAESLWFLGFIIPLALIIFFGGMLGVTLGIIKGSGTTLYYPNTISSTTDQNLLMNWGAFPTNLHQYFYILFRTFYSSWTPSIRQVSFSNQVFGSYLTTGVLIFLGILCVGGFIGMLILGIWMLYGFVFALHLMALVMIEIGFCFLGIAVYLFKMSICPSFAVDTHELRILYYVYGPNKISGTITKKAPVVLKQ